MNYKSISCSEKALLPIQTAALELSQALSLEIIFSDTQTVEVGVIRLLLGEDIFAFEEAASLVSEKPAQNEEWELIVETKSGGLLIGGATPRNIVRAALGWIKDPVGETNRYSSFIFKERYTQWDNSFNQWYRGTNGFNKRSHIREAARLGHTSIEINRYADAGGWHVNHRKFKDDSYAWYLSYGPALDSFVEGSLTKGVYPEDELEANCKDLLESAAIAREYGLRTGFMCYEPRCVSEKIFDKHPHLRGTRTDHPGRSFEPRYTLDIAHPDVLKHYEEMMEKIVVLIPDLKFLIFWTGDSGSGMPFAQFLYPGANGSYLSKSRTLDRLVGDYSSTLSRAARRHIADFELIMEIGWEYLDREREQIIKALPEGVSVSHPMGAETEVSVGDRMIKSYGGMRGDTKPGFTTSFIEYARSQGQNPFSEFNISGGRDFEPIFGLPYPKAVFEKVKRVAEHEIEKVFSAGGLFCPAQCPYQINQDLYTQLIREKNLENFDLKKYLSRMSVSHCKGDETSGGLLQQAWDIGEDAMAQWPTLSWFIKGPAMTQGRWITRPLVPNFDLLTEEERIPFEREVFTLSTDVGRRNIAFEGNVRIFNDEDMKWSGKVLGVEVIRRLNSVLEILSRADKRIEAIRDMYDRFEALKLLATTLKNTFELQAAVNTSLLEPDLASGFSSVIRQAQESEIENTKAWIRLLRESKTNCFHITSGDETPFIYKTPIEDLQVKLEAMESHLGDAPGPDIPHLREKGSHDSAWLEHVV